MIPGETTVGSMVAGTTVGTVDILLGGEFVMCGVVEFGMDEFGVVVLGLVEFGMTELGVEVPGVAGVGSLVAGVGFVGMLEGAPSLGAPNPGVVEFGVS